jgi:hypothetical protein
MKPRIKLVLSKSNFILFCECGTETTYGSQFKFDWNREMMLECRKCGSKYLPRLVVEAVKFDPGLVEYEKCVFAENANSRRDEL